MAKSPNPRTTRPLGGRITALLRLSLAVLVLGFFIYTYLSSNLNSNAILSRLVKGQFSATLYGAGIGGITVLVVLALTLLCGRLYCSVLCPLGTLQELVWRAGRLSLFRKRPRRRGYTAPPKLRYVIPLLVGVGLAFSLSPLMMLLDPISTFGRGMGALRGLMGGGPGPFIPVLAIPLVIVLVLSFFRGRAFCDWCPVGLTLGLFSSVSPFTIKISSRCVSCGLCEKKCPVGCIDSEKRRIAGERCVLCFSCIAACPTGSVAYGLVYGLGYGTGGLAASAGGPLSVGESRRGFLKGAGKASLLCGAAYLLGPSLKLFSHALERRAVDTAGIPGGLPILPPGGKNVQHYHARCIGCQACVASCPVGIIKPASSPHPVLNYTSSGCQYNCVECGKVCPTGAIGPLSVEEKRRTRVALSSLYFERCVVNTKRESCGACAEVCPTGAITMTAYSESGIPWLTMPVFDEQYCIGCGACYVACPAEPRAFVIEAVPEQTLTSGIRPGEEAGDELRIQNTEDFPF